MLFLLLKQGHMDHPFCDIGPMPWGDGAVDAQDLLVLAEYMVQNPPDVNDVNDL